MPRSTDQSGFALLLVIFVIALTTILVFEFADQIESFQRSAQGYTEQVQGTLMLKSAVNLGKLLIEAPKQPDYKDVDWQSDLWASIGSVPQIDLEGLNGQLRMTIVDEDGKIDINSIQQNGGFPGFNPNTVTPTPNTNQAAGGANAPVDSGTYWRNTLKDLFELEGFVREQYSPSSYRTLGNVGFEAADQVAVLVDWIDRDSDSFQVQGFQGNGIEANADRAWFYNRPLKHLAELAAVPGMTLERLQRIAPFVKVSPTPLGQSNSVNINTAPADVLLAMGFQQGDVQEIVDKRLSFPYKTENLAAVTAGYLNLANRLKVKSGEFSAYGRVVMPSRTFWVRAVIGAQQAGTGRKAVVRSLEFY